jgi:hypothetical protein
MCGEGPVIFTALGVILSNKILDFFPQKVVKEMYCLVLMGNVIGRMAAI